MGGEREDLCPLLLNLLQVGMFKVHPEIPESMSAEAKAFILKCFEPDPDKRACANDLLVDEFLKVSSKKKKTQPKLSGMLLYEGAGQTLNLKLLKGKMSP